MGVDKASSTKKSSKIKEQAVKNNSSKVLGKNMVDLEGHFRLLDELDKTMFKQRGHGSSQNKQREPS